MPGAPTGWRCGSDPGCTGKTEQFRDRRLSGGLARRGGPDQHAHLLRGPGGNHRRESGADQPRRRRHHACRRLSQLCRGFRHWIGPGRARRGNGCRRPFQPPPGSPGYRLGSQPAGQRSCPDVFRHGAQRLLREALRRVLPRRAVVISHSLALEPAFHRVDPFQPGPPGLHDDPGGRGGLVPALQDGLGPSPPSSGRGQAGGLRRRVADRTPAAPGAFSRRGSGRSRREPTSAWR